MEVLAENRPLPDTKSRRFRFYDLAFVDADLAAFVLVVRQGKPGLKEYEETAYLVQAVDADPLGGVPFAPPGTTYLLAKVDTPESDADRYEVYECFVPARAGDRGTCTCFGQRTQKSCKHLDSLGDAANGF